MKLRCVRRPIYFPIAAMMVFILAAIGLVSSFGSNADVGGSTSSSTLQRNQQQLQKRVGLQNLQRRSQPITAMALTSSLSAPSKSHILAPKSPLFRDGSVPSSRTAMPLSALTNSLESDQASSVAKGNKKRSMLRRILWNANPFAGRKEGRWKGGESTATLASKLLFSYVSPLLDVAADNNGKKNNRTLTEDDAFTTKEHRSMNFAVESLADNYDRSRTKARRKLEQKRQDNSGKKSKQSENTIKNSETIILLKALMRDQKSALILTGILRFLNTAVQAFPSLLVARLLRSIEAGTSTPLHESLKSAFLLVGVLCLKMITENQYFHNVVNMSTQVRGAIEGLIFDKSLRLPEGGSRVMTKDITGGNSDKKSNDVDHTVKGKPMKALGSGGVSYMVKKYFHLMFKKCPGGAYAIYIDNVV